MQEIEGRLKAFWHHIQALIQEGIDLHLSNKKTESL